MRAVFRITRLEKRNMLDKRYLIEKRVFLMYYPLCYVDGYGMCLQFMCNFCLDSIYDSVKVYHTDGANGVMRIEYDKSVYFDRHNRINVKTEWCEDTLLSIIDRIWQRVLLCFVAIESITKTVFKTMRKLILHYVILSLLLLTSCEKPIIDEKMGADDTNLILNFSPFQSYPFTRGAEEIGNSFTKINLMLYQAGTDTRVFDKIKTQTSDEEGFGVMNLSVPSGEYDLLVVGHSSSRSATLNKDKVSFTAYQGKKITDTFWYMGSIEVGEEVNSFDVIMNRATAMFRLIIEDETPASVVSFKFEYSGGSADFNPNNGKGVTNSKQSEIREFNEDGIYEVYTFPKDDKKLNITVTALDAEDNILSTRQFTEVPVVARYVTEYKGKFFDGSTGVVSGNTFNFTVNNTWEGTKTYTY